jgi:hypothetical protein
MLCAFAALALNVLTPSAAIQTASLVMTIPLLRWAGLFCFVTVTASHSNFCDAREAPEASVKGLPGLVQSVMDSVKTQGRFVG